MAKENSGNESDSELVEQNSSIKPFGWTWDIDTMMSDFRHSLGNFFWGNAPLRISQKQFPAMDIVENDGEYKIMVDMPGMEKEDIDIELKNRRMIIKAERSYQEEEEEEGFIRRERGYGSFCRSFLLPDDALVDEEFDASLKKGVLEIAIPREPEKPGKKVNIK